MKKLSREEERQLTKEEYVRYYNYLRWKFEESWINKLTLNQRRKLFPLLLSIIKLRNRMNGYTLDVIGDNRKEVSNRPIIYAITHIGKADIEVVSEVVNNHYYLLNGDFESLHDTVDGLFLGLNGVIYFNEHDKFDRANVKTRMISTLKTGGNIMYFPEGTWNLTANLPVLPCYYGIIEIAKKADAIIIPIAIEQYDKEFVVKVGNNFDVQKFVNDTWQTDAIQELRDILATLKWDIWESRGLFSRDDFSDDYYERFINDKIGEWPTLTVDDFHAATYKDKNIFSPDEVFEPIKKLCKQK